MILNKYQIGLPNILILPRMRLKLPLERLFLKAETMLLRLTNVLIH